MERVKTKGGDVKKTQDPNEGRGEKTGICHHKGV